MSDDDDYKQFSANYIQACQEQITALAKNPQMLEKALEPFMKIHQEYTGNNSTFMPGSNAEESNVESSNDPAMEYLHKILQKVQGIRRKGIPELKENLEEIHERLARLEEMNDRLMRIENHLLDGQVLHEGKKQKSMSDANEDED